MGLIVLDSSAVAGYLDADDPLHAGAEATIARLATERHGFALSTVTWSELLIGARLDYYPDELLRGFRRDMGIELIPVDERIAERAAALRAAYVRAHHRKDLRLPDALILATAELAPDAAGVVTGDHQWARIGGLGVAIVDVAEG